MFSGETSLQSPKNKVKGFLSEDPLSRKREAFIVTSEKLPPQTTIMGAIRYLLLQHSGFKLGTPEAESLIGKNTFRLEEPEDMGIIKEIGPVMITGNIGDEKSRLFLLPAPLDHQENNNSSSQYTPREKYNPKDSEYQGFMAWYEEGDSAARHQNCCYPEDFLFITYKQALHATTEEGTQRDDKSFHMQERVRLIDKKLAPRGKGLLSNPAFCVEVDLDDKNQKELISSLDQLKTFVSLGGRESTFKVEIEKFPIILKFNENKPESKKFYLLSPTWLPEDWRNKYGLEMAYLNKRRLRGAKSEITGDKVSLKLNSNRFIFADAGSVFIFREHNEMEKFRNKIEENKLRIGGFNRTAEL